MKNNFKKLSIIFNELGSEKFFVATAERTTVRLMSRFDSNLLDTLHANPKWRAELSIESNWIEFKRFNITITICLDIC